MLSVSRKLKSPRKIETFRSNLPLFREEKDQAGGQPNRASSSSGLFLMLQPLCVGLDCTLGKPMRRGLRNLFYAGQTAEADRSEKSFDSSGRLARRARPAKSRTTRSI